MPHSEDINKWITLAPPEFTFSVKFPANAQHATSTDTYATTDNWIAISNNFIYQAVAGKFSPHTTSIVKTNHGQRSFLKGEVESYFKSIQNVSTHRLILEEIKLASENKLNDYLVREYITTFHSNNGHTVNGQTLFYINEHFNYVFGVYCTQGNTNSETNFLASIKINKDPAASANTTTVQAKDYVCFGNTYLKTNQYQKAIYEYSKAIALNKNLAEAHSNRGVAYGGLKQYQKAIIDFSKAIELAPNNVSAYAYRSNTYCESKQYQKAIDDCSKSIELSPSTYLAAIGYLCRGKVYYKSGQYQNAIDDYTKAISLNPKTLATIYNDRAEAYEKLGHKDLAAKDKAEAIRLGYHPESK